MKRIDLNRLVLSVLGCFALTFTPPFAAAADDAKQTPAVDAPEKAAPAATPSQATPVPAGTPARDGEAKKEDPMAALIELFKKEENITNTLGMVMVWIPDGYRVGKHEVTQAQYERVNSANPSRFVGAQNPVDNVTLEEAGEFCRKLTETEIAAGKLPKGYFYSLPSEQQWESYVAEADLKDAITSYLGDRRNPEAVGQLEPNQLGLHDVRGNVWEWCTTPFARGASWRSHEDYLYTSFRWAGSPGQRYDDVGFRVTLQGTASSAPPTAAAPATEAPKPAARAY